jgi:transcriptional regulator with XRE-family HTH domain
MNKQLKSYLRPLRRRSGLTQRELAFLVGGTSVSRIERFKQVPSLPAMHACALLFGVQVTDLFPHLLGEVHRTLQFRTNELYERLQGSSSKQTRTKLDFLEGVLARLNHNPSNGI